MNTDEQSFKKKSMLELLHFSARHHRLDSCEEVLNALAAPGLKEDLRNMASQVRAETRPYWDASAFQLEVPQAHAAIQFAYDIFQETILEALNFGHRLMQAERDGILRALEYEKSSTGVSVDQHRRGRFVAEAKLKVLGERANELSQDMKRLVDERRRARRAHRALRSDLQSLLESARNGIDDGHLESSIDQMLCKLDHLTPLEWGPHVSNANDG